MRVMVGVVVLSGLLQVLSPGQRQAQPTGSAEAATYDEFMVRPPHERIRLFRGFSPEHQAQLVRTHLQRWIERNRGRLSAEQLKAMQANLAFITADRYRQPTRPEDEAVGRKLMAANLRLFLQEDLRQALTLQADYIPPTPQSPMR